MAIILDSEFWTHMRIRLGSRPLITVRQTTAKKKKIFHQNHRQFNKNNKQLKFGKSVLGFVRLSLNDRGERNVHDT